MGSAEEDSTIDEVSNVSAGEVQTVDTFQLVVNVLTNLHVSN